MGAEHATEARGANARRSWLALAALIAVTVCVLACGRSAPGAGTASPAPSDAEEAEGPSWQRLKPPADLPQDRPLRAAFLVVDGVYNSELAAPYDVLQHTVFHTKPGIEVFTVSADGAPITTAEGLRITPHHSFANAPAADILVVPSAEHSMDSDLDDATLIAWVRATGEKARFVMSLCDGAFVLAKAGLLDDHAATTFPADQDRFEQSFPAVELRRGVSFVHDGKRITSEGGAKSYDPAMYLVDHLYGEKVAQGVGRGLLIAWPPAPGAIPASVVVASPSAP